jgi:hypothetical protein
MCQNCTPMDPRVADKAAEKARNGIQEIVRRTDRLLSMCNGLEDRYREAGIAFHKTESAARHAMKHDTDQWGTRYTALEDAFLLISYEDIFAPLMGLIKRLTALRTRAQHVPSANKAHELLFTLESTLLPAINDLIANYENIERYMQKLEEGVHSLKVLNRRLQVNDIGERCAWYDPVLDLVNNKRTVRSRTDEYTWFSDWVYSLPEAQRALEVQERLDGFNPSGALFEDRLFAYSMDLIWRANEGFVAGNAE